MKSYQKQAETVTFFILRVVAAFLFTHHGAQKLLGWFGGVGPDGGTVPLVSQMGLAGVLEIFGGLLVLFGLAVRPVAFILSGEMAVAYFLAHHPQSMWPIVNHGEPAVLYCFLYLFFAAHGAGPWSLDALIWRRVSPEAS